MFFVICCYLFFCCYLLLLRSAVRCCLGYTTSALSLSFEIEGFCSPGTWVSDQTNADYQSLRPFAKNQYVYARTAFTLIYKFYQEWALHNYFRGQVASCNLLPSEEYGLGGYNTVRGYKERIVNGDNAFIWNLELRTPPVSILNALAGWKKFNDTFQFLLFYDYGLSGVRHAAPSQPKTSYLMSIGPGVRYNVAIRCNVRITVEDPFATRPRQSRSSAALLRICAILTHSPYRSQLRARIAGNTYM